MLGRNGTHFYIFMAEDNPSDVFFLRQALDQQRLDYVLVVARDGADAMSLLRNEGPYEAAGSPDFILLDLNLPKYDGKQLLKELRQLPRLASVPVAVFTSSTAPRDQEDVAALGASCFISKPTSLEEFMQVGVRIAELLKASCAQEMERGPRSRREKTTGVHGILPHEADTPVG
jgi:two-component system, chemotaxis family, response regulator Rcp1